MAIGGGGKQQVGKPYRVVDDGSPLGVHVYAPDGTEITAECFQYVIERTVTDAAIVRIQVWDDPHVVDGNLHKKWISGPVVCEISSGGVSGE